MSPEDRLRFHQEHSGPLMKGLHEWMEAQLAEHKTEPNSGLGKAISYLLNHWTKLTLFLRQPGAPIDNNIVERALKKAILNRKNALFYKTLNGAGVGDLFMSLIHTCELNGANPFDYLTELQRHAEELKRASIGVDAVELPRDAGAAASRPPPRNMMILPGRKGSSAAMLDDMLKWPQNGPLQRQNPITFLARHGRRRKCSAPACTPASPRNDQQTLPMQSRAMREYAARRGWTIALQVREVGSGAAKREAREKLLEAARRREIDVVLVWRLDRWGRSVTDLLATLQELEASRRRLRVADRGAGSDHASRSSHGRTAGCLRRVRTGDSAGTNSGWLGPCAAERQTAGSAGNRGRQRCGNPETASRRRQQIRDRSPASDRPHLSPPDSQRESGLNERRNRFASSANLSTENHTFRHEAAHLAPGVGAC